MGIFTVHTENGKSDFIITSKKRGKTTTWKILANWMTCLMTMIGAMSGAMSAKDMAMTTIWTSMANG